MGFVIQRRRALGDVVLIGAITQALPGPVVVQTAERYRPVAERLRGVDRVVGWDEPPPADHIRIDLQGGLRKHSIARRLRLWGLGSGRPAVTTLYGEAARVRPRPPPWIDLPRPDAKALVLIPGASTALKQPPPSLLREAADQWEGPVLVVGGPEDSAALDALTPLSIHQDRKGFTETFRAFAQAQVVVGGDTGLAHLAAACGIPTVAVAGPTHPDDGFLREHFAAVLGRNVGCRPCTLHRRTWCWRGDRRCFDLDPRELVRRIRACAG